jgi:hypothetical protein
MFRPIALIRGCGRRLRRCGFMELAEGLEPDPLITNHRQTKNHRLAALLTFAHDRAFSIISPERRANLNSAAMQASPGLLMISELARGPVFAHGGNHVREEGFRLAVRVWTLQPGRE